eukprot:2617023-Amphidinium_carterae.1
MKGMPRLTLQWAALFVVSQLQRVGATDANTCFATRPGLRVVLAGVVRKNFKVLLAGTKIQMTMLGFSCPRLHGQISCQFWGPEMESGALDIDVEQWNARSDSAMYQQYVASDAAIAYDVGSIGYSGRS